VALTNVIIKYSKVVLAFVKTNQSYAFISLHASSVALIIYELLLIIQLVQREWKK